MTDSITKNQTEIILKECEKIYGKVFAACLYGSQVCGYARAESDFDVIVVLNKYDARVKYTYIKGDFEIAFLAVDKKVLEDDINNAKYGDFIAGRLINPTIPLVNAEYIQNSELNIKKRIIDREIKKLVYDYKIDAKFLEINLLYFPFKKWHKLAAIYRPYLYSLDNMLRRELRRRNLNIILKNYKKAVRESKILYEIYPGWYGIDAEFIDNSLKEPVFMERIKITEREIEQAIAGYMTHKKAGDSDMDIFIEELTGKITREIKHIKASAFKHLLDDPGKYLNVVPQVRE